MNSHTYSLSITSCGQWCMTACLMLGLTHGSSSQACSCMQVGVDITGEAVQRAGRKVAAAYKQAQDPLSLPLQQLGGLAGGASQTAGVSSSKQLPSAQLYHGDIATANACKPGKCCDHLALATHCQPS